MRQDGHEVDYLIERPRALPLIIWLRDVILTLLVWILYLWLMRDFLALIADLGRWAMAGFTNGDQYESFHNAATFANYSIFASLVCVLFMFWSAYNIFRFAGKTRRRLSKNLGVEEVAQYYRVSQRQVMAWQKAGSLVIHHDKNGRLLEVAEI